LTKKPIFGEVQPGGEQPSLGKNAETIFSGPKGSRKTLTKLSDFADDPGVNGEQSDL
jgi:hypothetical protein